MVPVRREHLLPLATAVLLVQSTTASGTEGGGSLSRAATARSPAMSLCPPSISATVFSSIRATSREAGRRRLAAQSLRACVPTSSLTLWRRPGSRLSRSLVAISDSRSPFRSAFRAFQQAPSSGPPGLAARSVSARVSRDSPSVPQAARENLV